MAWQNVVTKLTSSPNLFHWSIFPQQKALAPPSLLIYVFTQQTFLHGGEGLADAAENC